jgi:drug/metabolite transporter (DMT)-like permease
MAVLPGVAGYFGWSYVLSNMPASRAGSFLTLFPVLAVLIAWVWLGEIPEPVSFAGSGVVLAGIVLVNRKGFKKKHFS